MMWIRLLCFVAVLVIANPVAAQYEVDCEGTDDETSAIVDGTCSDGSFDGTDSETGESVDGSCEFGGDLDAQNTNTGSQVSGECEGE